MEDALDNPLSPEQMDTLRVELARPEYADLSDADRFARLNAASEDPNPVATVPMVPRPVVASEIQGQLGPESLGRFLMSPMAPHIVNIINSGDRQSIGLYAFALTAADPPVITPEERDRILMLLGATVPDPEWTPAVRGPSRKQQLFGGATWSYPGSGIVGPTVIDFIPLAAIAEARL